MALKFKYGSKGEIPAELVSLYAEREGERVLDCDGVVEKNKLDECRATNVGLLKQVEDLKLRYEGIDPDEVRKQVEQKQRAEEDRQLMKSPPTHVNSVTLPNRPRSTALTQFLFAHTQLAAQTPSHGSGGYHGPVGRLSRRGFDSDPTPCPDPAAPPLAPAEPYSTLYHCRRAHRGYTL